MAEMEVKDSGGGGKGKPKKLSTRVDLTPMVDLGFLLITFFMFTTTMTSPTALDLFVPKDTDKKEEQTKVKQSGVFTILIDKENLYFYEGILKDMDGLKTADYKNIRKHLLEKKDRTDTADFVLIIKPSKAASYKSVVDILDEVVINEVKSYNLIDISEAEMAYVQQKKDQSKS